MSYIQRVHLVELVVYRNCSSRKWHPCLFIYSSSSLHSLPELICKPSSVLKVSRWRIQTQEVALVRVKLETLPHVRRPARAKKYQARRAKHRVYKLPKLFLLIATQATTPWNPLQLTHFAALKLFIKTKKHKPTRHGFFPAPPGEGFQPHAIESHSTVRAYAMQCRIRST